MQAHQLSGPRGFLQETAEKTESEEVRTRPAATHDVKKVRNNYGIATMFVTRPSGFLTNTACPLSRRPAREPLWKSYQQGFFIVGFANRDIEIDACAKFFFKRSFSNKDRLRGRNCCSLGIGLTKSGGGAWHPTNTNNPKSCRIPLVSREPRIANTSLLASLMLSEQGTVDVCKTCELRGGAIARLTTDPPVGERLNE